MKDERIQATTNRFGAMVFLLWYFLLSISLCYRGVVLRQHFREFWDIFAIFCIGILFGFIAYASRGVFAHAFKKIWLAICIVVSIVVVVTLAFMGQIHSVVDVGAILIASLVGMGVVIGIAYALNRRWKRKEGIEDEE